MFTFGGCKCYVIELRLSLVSTGTNPGPCTVHRSDRKFHTHLHYSILCICCQDCLSNLAVLDRLVPSGLEPLIYQNMDEMGGIRHRNGEPPCPSPVALYYISQPWLPEDVWTSTLNVGWGILGFCPHTFRWPRLSNRTPMDTVVWENITGATRQVLQRHCELNPTPLLTLKLLTVIATKL